MRAKFNRWWNGKTKAEKQFLGYLVTGSAFVLGLFAVIYLVASA